MAQTSDPHTNPQKGDRLQVKVVSMAPIGAIVRWGTDQTGVVRNQELEWGRTLDRPNLTLNVGEEFPAIVLDVGVDGRRVELSRKRALSDPWATVRRGTYQVGMVVRGEVVNAVQYGVYVEIEPGIEGLARRAVIPGGESGDVEDLLWLGDRIEAVVVGIDDGKHELVLSLLERLRRRASERARQSSLPLADEMSTLSDSLRAYYSVPRAGFVDVAGRSVHRITVIDNEAVFAQEFGDWLRHWGYEVRVLADGQQALEDNSLSDLVFVDIDLGNVSGFHVAAEILKRRPETRIVFMSGLGWFMNGGALPDDFVACGMLAKPFKDSEALDLLGRIERGERRDEQIALASEAENSGLVQRMAARLYSGRSLDQTLEAALEEIRQRMKGAAAVVFKVDRFTQKTTAHVTSGIANADTLKKARWELRFSVVMDVAADRQEVIAGAASLDKKFDSLRQLFGFESCIGVPIPNAGLDAWYALFIFDSKPDRYDRDDLPQVTSMAWLLGSRIEADVTHMLIQNAQQFILVGQVSSSLLHELRNKMSIVRRASANLLLDCEDMRSETRPLSPHLWGARVTTRAEKIAAASDQLQDLVSAYVSLTRREEPKAVDVNHLLSTTLHQITPIGIEQHVDVSRHFEPHLPSVMAVSVHLEQIFLNIALNAMQHMGIQRERYDTIAAHKPGSLRGMLKISTALDRQDTQRPLKIRFSDDGPGIHRKHWDWIFQFGTSTRPGGTGLGLFVCRDLLAAMGGRIEVERSLMFLGSTFLIELPVAS
jgi:signal transduction histidine kinase/predicted RNA-binding protein with RPS1 domain